jgi:ADP-heptose:LPS heptosyltransferase
LLADEPGIGPCRRLAPPWVAPSNKYRIWERNWRDYVRDFLALRKIDFDLLVSPRCDPRDSLQTRLLKARSVAGFGAAGGKDWFTIDAGVSATDYQTYPRIDVMATFGERLTGRAIDPAPHLKPPQDGGIKSILSQHGCTAGPVLAVSFGAAHPIRRWDSATIAEILRRVAAEVGFFVIIAEPGPAQAAIELPDGKPGMIWRTNLASIKALLAEIDLLFCADSGLMHIAAALGTKVVAVFGPTSPILFGPSGTGHAVIAVEPMPCRPCYDACIYASPICLDQIGPDNVVPALQRALRQGA